MPQEDAAGCFCGWVQARSASPRAWTLDENATYGLVVVVVLLVPGVVVVVAGGVVVVEPDAAGSLVVVVVVDVVSLSPQAASSSRADVPSAKEIFLIPIPLC